MSKDNILQVMVFIYCFPPAGGHFGQGRPGAGRAGLCAQHPVGELTDLGGNQLTAS